MEYGLIGEKLGHSYSKIIHEKLSDYKYELNPLNKEEFHIFMKEKNFKGINVTIPYKEDVIPYIDKLDDNARIIGACNTILNKDNLLYGFNTDYNGFLFTLEHEGIDVKNKKVIILGTGGASKAVIRVVEHLCAKEIIMVKNTATNGAITYEDCFRKHLDANIIVNTSPVGMYPNVDKSPIDVSLFHTLEAVIDIIYNPLQTKLLQESSSLGIKTVNGLLMLVAQAVYAASYFLDGKIDKELILKIYYELEETFNN